MTEQDLHQMRQLIREEVRPIIREEVPPLIQGLREEFIERLDAAVVSVGNDFSDLRKETRARFEQIEHRLDAQERLLTRLSDSFAGLSSEVAALNRWASRLDRDNLDLHATQAAQQRAIDELAKRWTKGPQQ